MDNSKDKKTGSKFKSSFNKSKSISSAMDDLEKGRPISKPDFEGETPVDSTEDMILEDSISDFDNDDIVDSYLNDFEKDGVNLEDLNMEGVNLEDLENSKSNTIDSSFNDPKFDSDEDFNEIFISPNDGDIKEDLEDTNSNDVVIENYLDDIDYHTGDVVIDDDNLENIDYPNLNNEPSEGFILEDDSLEFSMPESSKSTDSNSLKSLIKSIFYSKSKVFAIICLIVGLLIIIYGFMSFSNVSDRVVDNVLLGEAGSWSIIIILIGLIIILLDVFFFVYYKKSLSSSRFTNTQIKNTFDTIDKIKSIDSDYYNDEPNISSSIFKDLLKNDNEESLEDDLNSNFKDEIIENPNSMDLKSVDAKITTDNLNDISNQDEDSSNDKVDDAVFDKENSNV